MHTYEFTYTDGSTSLGYGATVGKAKYNKYLDVSDCIDMSFLQFLQEVKVRKVSAPSDAYKYINRAYSRHFKVGDQIRIEARAEGKEMHGVVVYPTSHCHYVNVQLDGENHASLFHPSSVSDPIPTTPERMKERGMAV